MGGVGARLQRGGSMRERRWRVAAIRTLTCVCVCVWVCVCVCVCVRERGLWRGGLRGFLLGVGSVVVG